MKRMKRILPAVAVFATICLVGVGLAQPQAAPVKKRAMTSDQAFKNVRVLKGIPLDDFMGTMGVMTGSLSFDCSDCHNGAGTDTVDWALDTPRKVVARSMVVMVQKLNRESFGGRQVVTCYSCHHGRDRPPTTVAMESVYGPPSTDSDDVIQQAEGQPAADKLIDNYIRALGGAEKLSSVKSYAATGHVISFGGLGGDARATLYAKAPNQRTLIIDYKDAPGRGDTTRTFDGQSAWLRTPMNVLGEYELSGGELAGAKLDAMLSFPGQMKQFLTKLRVGLRRPSAICPRRLRRHRKRTTPVSGKTCWST